MSELNKTQDELNWAREGQNEIMELLHEFRGRYTVQGVMPMKVWVTFPKKLYTLWFASAPKFIWLVPSIDIYASSLSYRVEFVVIHLHDFSH